MKNTAEFRSSRQGNEQKNPGEITVEAYSGYTAEEKPLSLDIGFGRLKIKEVLRSTIVESGPERCRKKVFYVECEDSKKYEIYYDLDLGKWFLQRG